jgi:SAM-dependent methyltransferase
MATAAPRQRRSLSHVGGPIDLGGSRVEALALAHAMEVAPEPATPNKSDGEDRAHVHGFHTYPARMHPVTAARLVEAFSQKGDSVLDPFCGSGTVLVEALCLGRAATGIDLNPVAVKLATTKTRRRQVGELDQLVALARQAAAFADARRRARAGATRRYSGEDVALFDAHVLLELDGLRAGIASTTEPMRSDLMMVLSSLLVKVSRRRADTSEETQARRLAAGYPSKLLVKKTIELAKRIDAFERLLPSPRPSVRVSLDDATRLATVRDREIDFALTSPPYAGTYDYLAHHALRMRWLELDPKGLERGEVGSRRRYAALRGNDARAAWAAELVTLLSAAERVMKRDAFLVLFIGDSAVGEAEHGEALRADDMVADAAGKTRFERVARASQERPHFHGPSIQVFRKRPRREHVLLLRRR